MERKPIKARLQNGFNGDCWQPNGNKISEWIRLFGKEAFTINVYKFSHISDHQPIFVYNFYATNVYKFSKFLTIHLPSIVNVNCERTLSTP